MIQIPNLGPIKNNAYIIENGNNSILIDAPPEPENILKALDEKKLKIKYIVITHGHTDHIASAALLKEKTGAEIIVHEGDLKMFLKPWNLLAVRAKPFTPDILIKDSEEIKLGNKRMTAIKVIHTPGHSQGSICLYFQKEKSIFTGDTLFKSAIGRTDFPGGNYNQLIKNIKEKLFTLPGETKVFPGHFSSTTIKDESASFSF